MTVESMNLPRANSCRRLTRRERAELRQLLRLRWAVEDQHSNLRRTLLRLCGKGLAEDVANNVEGVISGAKAQVIELVGQAFNQKCVELFNERQARREPGGL
jgi:hypothetical protein